MFLRTLLAAFCLATPALAQSAGPQGGEGQNMRAQEWRSAGGHATHRAVGPFAKEGHNLASSDSGAPIWQPLVEDFLKTVK